jgi:hypothetical protein
MSKTTADIIIFGLIAAWIIGLGVLAIVYVRRAVRRPTRLRVTSVWDRLDNGARAAALVTFLVLMAQVGAHRLAGGV